MGIFNIFKKLIGREETVSRPPKAPTVYDFSSKPVEDLDSFEGTAEQYFTWIFSYYFPHLQVQKKAIAATNGSWSYGEMPASFIFSQEDKVVLVVILCHGQEYRRAAIRHTVEEYESMGIPVQRYYSNFLNDSNYVVERMKSAL